MNFTQFLEILWRQEPTGTNGFEGLVALLMEDLIGQRFFLSRSGTQNGRDMASEGKTGNFIAVECKRYRDNTALGSAELLSKFFSAATTDPVPDSWIVVTTKRLGEQTERQLRQVIYKWSITYFSIDAEGDEKSMLSTLFASAPGLVSEHLRRGNPGISEKEALEVYQFLNEIAESEHFPTKIDQLYIAS